MKLITLDWETYWAADYTVKQMTTEAYVRDPRFESILLGYKVDDGRTGYVVGQGAIQTLLDSLDIENNAVLCHHAHFDGLILAHHFGHSPKVWFDTLSMARAIHGVEVGGSLGKLLVHYGKLNATQVQKGDNLWTKGMHLVDFGNPVISDRLMHYGRYCCDDVQGTYEIFQIMLAEGFPKAELRQIDAIVRMFTEPKLLLDEEMLRDYAKSIKANKLTLLFEAGVTLEEVMSNEKFAEALRRLGVEPPMKISPTTGKPAYALAKTDKGLKALEEHDDDRVQTLVAARLGNKTTINETRAIRMADMVARGPACLYYKYSGAMQTMRVAGGDSMNWQNLSNGTPLREAIYAPDGFVIVVADSRNIESRVLDWLAMQEDMLDVYRLFDRGEGPDVYCVMASRLYGREITLTDKLERKTGKHVKLGCGYQMGPDRLGETARIIGGLIMQPSESARGVQVYRESHPMVKQLWNRGQSALSALASGPDDDTKYLDSRGLLALEKGAIMLPNGLRIKYPQLSFDKESGWSFMGRKGTERMHLYGGKVTEHVVQALSRIVVMDQTIEVGRKFEVPISYVMTTHDEGAWVVPEDQADAVVEFAGQCMSQPPKWAPDLPVAAEAHAAVRYGDAK